MRELQVLPYVNNYGKRGVNAVMKQEERMKQETSERHPRGGLYFDDFIVGHLYEHRLRRTVTQMDNMLFSNMTLNPQPLHIDRAFLRARRPSGASR